MQFTNKHNLPLPVFKALTTDDYERRGDFSVTELIGPPRIAVLKKRHDANIVVDCMSRFYMLMGKAMHYVMEIAKVDGAIVEQRFTFPFEVDGVVYQISMASDYVWPEEEAYHMLDFKMTSLYSIKHGTKPEWVAQLNLYRYGFTFQGYTVEFTDLVAFLRDWSRAEQRKKPHNYPSAEIQCLEVYKWDKATTEEFLTDRIRLHVAAREQADDDLEECTAKERWEKFTCWAVLKKPGGDAVSGLAKCPTEAAAIEGMEQRKEAQRKAKEEKRKLTQYNNMVVEFRQGENTRCEYYCDAKHFCGQYKAMNKDKLPF